MFFMSWSRSVLRISIGLLNRDRHFDPKGINYAPFPLDNNVFLK
jgi:hypothetical protein